MAVTHKISVGALVHRIEQSGDIHFRFSSRSNAVDGIKGHQKLQKSRSEDYLAEQSVTDLIDYGDFFLELKGRADGCLPGRGTLLVEEIKTLKVDVERLPEQVTRIHWAQVRVYGCLLAREYGVSEVTLRLTYYHLDREQESSFDDVWNITELETEYRRLMDAYAKFMAERLKWSLTRDESILPLNIPFGEFRSGQREMAVSVYRALASEGQVVLQAPTGIGKTLGSLFPTVKALQDQGYARIFYLSAKTSGQQMARTAIDQMREGGLKIRDVTITAKDKICFNPGTPCDPEYCQYARGYYDKLPKVIGQVQQSERSFERTEIEQLAKQHEVCPFELGLDLSDIADVVIGDYNYVFDPSVYLRRHFDEPEKYAMLMDESHNLVDRGRDMFSASLKKDSVLSLRRLIGDAAPTLKSALTGVNKAMLDLTREVQGEESLKAFPVALERSLKKFTQAAEVWLDEHHAGLFHSELLEFYFDALRFLRVGEQADDDYVCIISKSNKETVLKWFCINPSVRLKEGFDRLSSSVCFSATLNPKNYYHSLLGLQEESDWYQLPSPFSPENLGVFSTSFLSTTYHNRENSLYDLVDTLSSVIQSKAGNYIVYFPSYAYLDMVYNKFKERYPEVRLVAQQPSMSDEERQDFLLAFEEGQAKLLGFAVMGGVFGEGVDLKGNSLIGVVIVGVGLPQINLERNLIRDYFDSEGAGFEYAYQYPGMVRVLQTAGRVIRSESDRGIVCLIDHRFNEMSYRQLFPEHWRLTQVKSIQHLEQSLATFWRQFEVQ